MDTNSIIHPEDSNHSWNFTASGFPEIDTEVAKAAPAADSIAMPPVDEDDELETAYDTTMLDCKRVAMRIALESQTLEDGLLCLCRCLLTRRREIGNGS